MLKFSKRWITKTYQSIHSSIKYHLVERIVFFSILFLFQVNKCNLTRQGQIQKWKYCRLQVKIKRLLYCIYYYHQNDKDKHSMKKETMIFFFSSTTIIFIKNFILVLIPFELKIFVKKSPLCNSKSTNQ